MPMLPRLPGAQKHNPQFYFFFCQTGLLCTRLALNPVFPPPEFWDSLYCVIISFYLFIYFRFIFIFVCLDLLSAYMSVCGCQIPWI